jgi:hypothetical protein
MRRQSGKPAGEHFGDKQDLPYVIELWSHSERDVVERVLARTLNETLARAVFSTAAAEHPDRRVTLREGPSMVADTGLR